jgi:hypothetical protein
MKQQRIMVLLVAGALLLVTGCSSLLPTETSTTKSHWKSYSDAENAFEQIKPHSTDTNCLRLLGFYPPVSPNVKLLTYVDIIQIFMPNPGIRQKDLPEAVRECIDAREHGYGYLIDLQNTNSHRHGNVFLDMFGFKRKTHIEGWRFKGLILITNGVVVYKLSSGEPQISRDNNTTRPLGPLQELDRVVFSVVNVTK